MISLKNNRRVFWFLQTSGWLLFLVLSLLYYLVRGALSGPIFARYAAASAAGFLATLLLRSVYKKTRLTDRAILSLSLLTVAMSLLGANLTVWLADLIKIPFLGTASLKGNLVPAAYVRRVLWWLPPILGWSALYVGIKFWQAWTVQKERTEKAKALAQAAQLQMLRYRLNPHFLFNSLNSIRALIAEDKTAAKTMVTELSEFLRYSLVSKNYKNVPLRDEVDSVRHYFNIQKMRYEKKLEVAFDIDPAAEEYPILSFLIHPLAENAVKHGLRTSPLPLRIRIAARALDGRLQIEVVNSGSWTEAAGQRTDHTLATGLENVRQRLAEAYPHKHQLDIFEKEGFVHARLVLEKDVRS